MKSCFTLVICFFLLNLQSQEQTPPIIDMHLHALPANFMGPPPLAFCLPTKDIPLKQHGVPYSQTFIQLQKDPKSMNPDCEPLWSTPDSREIMTKTFDIMERYNVIGVTSGPLVHEYKKNRPDKIINGLFFNLAYNPPPLDSLRTWFQNGTYEVFGEITNQYAGVTADDEKFEPYLALAAELDVPVGIHIGPGPPGVAYVNSPNYRAHHHDPFQLEEVLIKYPDLRVYICHAAWPMLDNLLALLFNHPQVYLDISIINYAFPPAEFNRYLSRIVEAGFSKRVLFGSDQMVWPETLEIAIKSILNAEYLSEEQKRDIFYNNAARFLNLPEETIAKHHGQ